MTNKTPTAPGFYYYRGGDIVYVYGGPGYLWVMTFGTAGTYSVEEMDPTQWAGPVPMPGEWVSRAEHDELIRNLEDRI